VAAADADLAGIDALTGRIGDGDGAESRLQLLGEPQRHLTRRRGDGIADARLGVIALIDAENARNPRLDAQLVENQIRSADIAVLNKVDLVNRAHRDALRGWIHSLAPDARILEAVQARVPLDVVLGTGGRSAASRIDRSDAHDHSHALSAWTYRTR